MKDRNSQRIGEKKPLPYIEYWVNRTSYSLGYRLIGKDKTVLYASSNRLETMGDLKRSILAIAGCFCPAEWPAYIKKVEERGSSMRYFVELSEERIIPLYRINPPRNIYNYGPG